MVSFEQFYIKMDKKLAISSVIIHESAIRGLFKNGILLKLWETLKKKAHSVKLVGDSFKTISPKIESLLITTEDPLFYHWQEFLIKIKNSNDTLHSISENHSEIVNKCHERNIEDKSVKEIITLLSDVAQSVENAILVTDLFQPLLRELVISATNSGLVEISVEMISVFDFIIIFYARCCLTHSEFLNFKISYFSELQETELFDSKTRNFLISKHSDFLFEAPILKNSIGIINKIENCNYSGDLNHLINNLSGISHDNALELFKTALSRHNVSFDARHIIGGTGEEWGCDFLLESRVGLQIKVEGEIDRKELGKLSDQYLKAQNRIGNLVAYVIAFFANINDTTPKQGTAMSKGDWRQDQITRIITKFAGYENPPVKVIRPETVAKFLGSDLP